MEAFNDIEAVLDSLQMINSTIVRAYHQEVGAKKGLTIRILGTRRWFCDRNSSPRQCSSTVGSRRHHGGEVSDFKGYAPVMADGPQPKVLVAYKGYYADFIWQDMEKRGGVAVIPSKRNRKIQVPVNGHIYALRNPIEWCFDTTKNA